MSERYVDQPLSSLLEVYPYLADLLASYGIEAAKDSRSLAEHAAEFDMDEALDLTRLDHDIDQTIRSVAQLACGVDAVRSLTVVAGRNKAGEPEAFGELTLQAGTVTAIVGPTGSGKSRLLADIEWMAQGDTPTGRSVLTDGQSPDPRWRFSPTHKLVAQLSQNMNFVMDLEVREFLRLHAETRMVSDAAERVDRILECALDLAGEPFDASTPVTSLSGGQSRALMIADTAILSRSPIVLIDEIENAGIDRQKALELLLAEDKIVLLATHDPLLALLADLRLVIAGGGIVRVLQTSDGEKVLLRELYGMDEKLGRLRQRLRAGAVLG